MRPRRTIHVAAAVGLALLQGVASHAAQTACQQGDAARAGCLSAERLRELVEYQDPVLEKTLRRALATAAEAAECVNAADLEAAAPEAVQDRQCLRQKLVEFYDQVSRPGTQPGDLHFRDLLARASSRVRYCMVEQSAPVSRCLKLVESALGDYRFVFESARDILEAPNDPTHLELASALAIPLEAPEPDVAKYREFVDLALENSLRFPRLFGKAIGEALGPTLCAGYRLYPEERAQTAQLYNLLIRFDRGNMASSRHVYQFVEELRTFFRPEAGLESFLRLQPPDWSGSPPPCAKEDFGLVFPEFSVAPGFRFPSRSDTEEALDHLQTLLTETAQLAENRNHVWKPYHRMGLLLFQAAQSLRVSARRAPEARKTRELLIEKARDSLLMRGAEPTAIPFDPKPLQQALGQLLQDYGDELVADARLDALKQFAEETLELGETILTDSQKRRLHGLLAIAHFVGDDETTALVHMEKSDLKLEQLRTIRKAYRDTGLGIRPLPSR